MIKKTLSCSLSILLSTPFLANAQSPIEQVVIAPQCLVDQAKIDHHILASRQHFFLLKVDETALNKLIAAKKNQSKPCGGFLNVTDDWVQFNAKTIAKPSNANAFLNAYIEKKKPALVPETKTEYKIRYEKQVTQLLSQLNPDNMWKDLTTLTQFPDRYSMSNNGLKAANWIKSQIETIAKNTGHSEDVNVYFVKTGGDRSYYKQPSVVAKFGKGDDPAIVIGGHMDTLSSFSSKKPGADDDGTGSVTVLEVARTILSSGLQFNRPIYFVWYAAEEMGLVGSQYVVADFQKKKIPVEAVMQFDMTGYEYQNAPDIWLIKDYVNEDLTTFLETLINTYVKKPVHYTQCGYACSDHASWYNAGFSSCMPSESSFEHYNPHIHTSEDKMDYLSLDHMKDMAKLGLAYVVELAEPAA